MIPEYKELVDYHNKYQKEVTIIVTPYCEGGCKYCLYHREKIGDRKYDQLTNVVFNYLQKLDYSQQNAIISLEGGELLSTALVEDEEYVKYLHMMFDNLFRMTRKSKGSHVCLSTSLENVDEIGMSVLMEILQDHPDLRVNIAYTMERTKTDEKEHKFWNNAFMLKDRYRLGMGVLMTEGFIERTMLKRLAGFAWNKTVDFAEPHMFGDFTFSYDGINATKVYEDILGETDSRLDPKSRRGFPSFHHMDVYLTSEGIRNGFELLRRPDSIPEEEWERLQNDEEYRLYGYQQVLDWYGCCDCKYLMTCQGMLYSSYYTQKHYGNRKCLYK